MNKDTWIFVCQKYGKFLNILISHFIKHKPLISEEWHLVFSHFIIFSKKFYLFCFSVKKTRGLKIKGKDGKCLTHIYLFYIFIKSEMRNLLLLSLKMLEQWAWSFGLRFCSEIYLRIFVLISPPKSSTKI